MNIRLLTILVRRTRNRLSQRAYRRRQAEYVKELRTYFEAGDRPESEAFKQLRSENVYLRKQLVEIQSKLTRLTETMKALAGSVSNVLDECSAERSESETAENEPSVEQNGSGSRDNISNPELLDSAVRSVDAAYDPFMPLPESLVTASHLSGSSQIAARPEPSCLRLRWGSISEDTSYLLPPQIPNIWNYEYQMGLQPYASALSGSECSRLRLHKAWIETNSPFSDHISALCHLMKTKIGQIGSQLIHPEMYITSEYTFRI